MDISTAGTKRVCAECAARFFDLNRDPIHCPKCEAVFHVPEPPPLRPPRGPRAFQRYPAAVAQPVMAEADADADDDSEDKEDEAADALLLDADDDLDGDKAAEAVIPIPAPDERDI